MCMVVYVGDVECGSGEELAREIGGADKLVWSPGVENVDLTHCLCGLDAKATAARAGFVAEQEDFFLDWVFTRTASQAR